MSIGNATIGSGTIGDPGPRMALSLTVFGDRVAVVEEVEDYVLKQLAPEVTLWPSDEPVDGSIVMAFRRVDGPSRDVLSDFPAGAPPRPTLYIVDPYYESSVPRDGKDWVVPLHWDTNAAATRAVEDVKRWFEATFGRSEKNLSTLNGPAVTAIEDLTGYVSTLLENTHLKNLVADLEAEVKATRSELTEATIQARTFMALYEQTRLENEALKLELRKGPVIDRGSASIRTKLLARTGGFLLATLGGFVGQVGANEVDHRRHPDEDMQELADAVRELPERCDQVIVILEQPQTYTVGPLRDEGEVGRPIIDPRTTTGEPDVIPDPRGDPTQKWPDGHTESTLGERGIGGVG